MIPPIGVTPATRTPPERATGSSSESKLIATTARASGLMSPSLARVDGRAHGGDLLEAEDRHRRKERRIDVAARERRSPGRSGGRRARRDRGDLAVAHDERALRRCPAPTRPGGSSRRRSRRTGGDAGSRLRVRATAPGATAAGQRARERAPRPGASSRHPRLLRRRLVRRLLVLVVGLVLVALERRLRLRHERRALRLERRPGREVGRAVEVLLPLDPRLERASRTSRADRRSRRRSRRPCRPRASRRARRCRAASPGWTSRTPAPRPAARRRT